MIITYSKVVSLAIKPQNSLKIEVLQVLIWKLFIKMRWRCKKRVNQLKKKQTYIIITIGHIRRREGGYNMKLKKFLAATLAATMVMSSAMTVCAGYYDSSASSSESTTVSEDVKAANVPIAVAGTNVTTTIAGGYAAKSVQGTAVTTPLAQVKANLGLKDGQVPAITIYDTDLAKSPAAMACVNAAVEAMGAGAEAVAVLNINLYAKENNNVVTLEDGSVAMVTGLPKNADLTKTYSVVCVQPGGVVTILEDLDSNPATVTFDVQAGIGTYALVAQ